VTAARHRQSIWTHHIVKVVRTFRERLLAGFSWNVVSAVSLQGSVLLSTIIVARLLGLESFGAYAVLVSTVVTAAAIAQGGTGLVATKFVAESLANDPVRVGQVLDLCRVFTFAMGVLMAALVFAMAEVLSVNVLGRPQLVEMVRLVALATFFQVTVSYQIGALQGFGAFKELGRAGLAAGLAHIAATAIGAWFGQTTGALLGFVVASALRTAAFGFVLRSVRRAHGVPRRAPLALQEFQRIWRFALPTGLAGIVTMPSLWLVTILLARLPDGLAMVALFSVANQVRLAVLQLPSLLNAVSFSVLSRLKGARESAGFRSVFWSNVVLNLGFSTLAVGVLVIAAAPVLGLYGPEFQAGRLVLVVLLVSVLPEMLSMSFYQLIQAAGRMWHSLFLIAIPRDVLYFVLAAMLVPAHGAIAAAYAYLIAHAVGLAATLVVAYRFAPAAIRPRAGLNPGRSI
jgi:O-antigen/teichoic acid export membrane protein